MEKLIKAYFAGGCFWCMEESFEKLEGVQEVISGYSGGITKIQLIKKLPLVIQVILKVVEIIYDENIISYEELLKNFGLI